MTAPHVYRRDHGARVELPNGETWHVREGWDGRAWLWKQDSEHWCRKPVRSVEEGIRLLIYVNEYEMTDERGERVK